MTTLSMHNKMLLFSKNCWFITEYI